MYACLPHQLIGNDRFCDGLKEDVMEYMADALVEVGWGPGNLFFQDDGVEECREMYRYLKDEEGVGTWSLEVLPG